MLVLRLLLFTGFLVVVLRAEDPASDLEDDDDEDFKDPDGGVSDDAEDDAMIKDDEPQEQEELLVPKTRPLYSPPEARGNVFFTDAFVSEEDFRKKWILSKAKKDAVDDAVAKYDGRWSIEEPSDNPLQQDLGLVLKTRAKHHAISALLDKPFKFTGKQFVVQYEVKFQNGLDCGGAYIKLLSQDSRLDLTNVHDKTPYTIMFGPDKCGNDHKLHFIFRHKNPVKGTFEEKHAKKPTASLDSYFTDKKTHLYTLVVDSENKFEVYIDQNLINSGSLLSDMNPPINPPKEISDPSDKKPADWDERERIPDPDAEKPDDWDESAPEMIEDENAVKPEGWLDDEPELIPDSTAEKPSDWDDDTDGEWEPPMINNPKCESAPGCGEWTRPKVKNPKYKGKWVHPDMDNPNYKGKWTARMIPNPDYFEDTMPYKMTPIAAVGLELWSMSDRILFDNFIITDDLKVADRWAADSWKLKQIEELATAGGFVQSVLDAANERPWLWALLVVVLALPLVLIIVYCCMPGSKDDDETARRKKTDELAPDDIKGEGEEEGEEEEEQLEGEEQAGDQDQVPETGPEQEEEVVAAEPNRPGTPSHKKQTKADLEVKETDLKASQDLVSSQAKGDGSGPQ